MKSKDIFSFLSGAILTFLCGYFFYFKSRIDTFETQIQTCYEEKKECETEVKIYKELDKKIRILENDNEQKFREIENLTDRLKSKDDDLIKKDIEIKEKDNEILDLMDKLHNNIQKGGTFELKKELERLNDKIATLNKEKADLEIDKTNLSNEIKSLKDKILSLENEVSELTDVIIPNLKDSLKVVTNELSYQKGLNQLRNFRCGLSNIQILPNENEIRFQLNFNQENINQINRYYGGSKITLSPVIENQSTGQILTHKILNFEHFSIHKINFGQNVPIIFSPREIDFRTIYKRKNALNMTKGDKYSIKIIFEELEKMVICEQVIFLEKR